jgi:Copper transport outer membrane protein, MctB
MINFRFHLVSLIAVFLALGLGILVGSSVVDRAIVDNLRDEIDKVRKDSREANAQLRERDASVSALEDFVTESATYAVDQRLIDVPVALIAERGSAGDVARETLETLQAAGAASPGVFWLTDRWQLESADDSQALQEALDLSGNNATLRADGLDELARRLSEPANGRRRSPDVLEALRRAHFLDFTDGDRKALDRFPQRAGRVLVVTGTDSELNGSGSMVALVQSLVSARVPTVVAEAYDSRDGATPAPERGASVAPVRGDATLQQDVSTIDDLELVQGRVASVVALEQIASGTVGHFGYGQTASDGVLPQRAP